MSLPANFNSGFSKKSTAEDVTAGLDLSGKTILVTGVGSGLGKEAMRVLALRGAKVLGVDRTLDIAKAASDEVSGETLPYGCDLSDPSAISAFAKSIVNEHKVIDILLANAGIMSPPHTVVNGYSEPLEIQFAVNFMANFVLVNHLLPAIKKAPSGRIALVASDGYLSANRKRPINLDDLDCSESYDALTTYGQSKMAVVQFNKMLAKKLDGTGVTSNAVHPGVIRTNLAKESKNIKVKIIGALAGPWTRSIPQGTATHCFVAVHPSIEGVSGLYFGDSNPRDLKPVADQPELAEALWAKAEELAADYIGDWAF